MDLPSTDLSDLSALSSGGQRRSSRLQTTSAAALSAARRDSLGSSTNGTAGSTPAMLSSRSTPGSSRNTPEDIADDEERDPTPTKRTGLRWKREKPKETPADIMKEAMQPLTDEERRSWPGWVELESEPALFNYILREYGVRDVKVKEVIDLGDEMLNLLPKPVYGLIFLFKYWDEEDEEAEELPKCPNHVWFANQTVTNACATIALLNIVMNIPKIDLGQNLSAFKTETKGLKPAYRGQELGKNAFIRNIHNSFARRMDMLNADLALSNDVDKWKRVRNAKKRKGAARRSHTKTKEKKNEEDPGFHFIAYVPIKDVVWRLDGMQRQPVNLGDVGKDWMAIARENINLHIAQHLDDGLQFSLMSLCRSPLRSIPEQLAENLYSFAAVEKALTTALPDWKQFIEFDESSPPLPHEPNESFALSKELLSHSYVSESVQKKLRIYATDPTELIDIRRQILTEQAQLQNSYVEEVAIIEQENEQAARRKIDYTPVIYNSIKKLAEEGILKEIVRDLIESGKMKPS